MAEDWMENRTIELPVGEADYESEGPHPDLSAVSDEPEDIDAISWLQREREDGAVLGEIVLNGRRLKIAAITEAEDNKLLQASKKMSKTRPGQTEMDPLMYRRRFIAMSLSKADPAHPINAEDLQSARTGILTQIQRAIQELSGTQTQATVIDPFASLG